MNVSSSPDITERFLTRKALADRWQLSTETLKRRERCGFLPYLKLGRGVRYRLTDIEYLEADAEVRRSAASIAQPQPKGSKSDES